MLYSCRCRYPLSYWKHYRARNLQAPYVREGIVLGSTVVRTQRPHDIVIQRLDERRYALAVDGIVRYVGSEEECQRRLAMLVPNNDRAGQDEALGRLWRIMR
jgi:hypothetical protein